MQPFPTDQATRRLRVEFGLQPSSVFASASEARPTTSTHQALFVHFKTMQRLSSSTSSSTIKTSHCHKHGSERTSTAVEAASMLPERAMIWLILCLFALELFATYSSCQRVRYVLYKTAFGFIPPRYRERLICNALDAV
jgi:hypothetical protein